MRLPSASKIELAMACEASVVLPKTETTNEAAERGTEIHKFIADAIRYGRETALETVKEHRDICEALDLVTIMSLVGDSAPMTEMAFAYDTQANFARLIGKNTDRNYGHLGTHELAGTADLLAETDDEIVLIDFKTGRTNLGKSEDNWQLRALSVMASNYFGVESVRMGIAQLRTDGSWYLDMFRAEVYTLDAWALDLKKLVERIYKAEAQMRDLGDPNTRPGEHCTWCPSLSSCPAHTALVKALPTGFATLDEQIAELTPARAAAAWAELQKYEQLVKRMKSSLVQYARQTPLELPNGKVLKEVAQTRRDEINPTIALGVLREQFGDSVAAHAIEGSVTQESIKRALKQAGRSGVIALAKDAIRAIEQAGGVEFKEVRTVKEVNGQITDGECDNEAA